MGLINPEFDEVFISTSPTTSHLAFVSVYTEQVTSNS